METAFAIDTALHPATAPWPAPPGGSDPGAHTMKTLGCSRGGRLWMIGLAAILCVAVLCLVVALGSTGSDQSRAWRSARPADYQNFCESYTYRHSFVGVTNQTSGEGFLGEWHTGPGVDAKVPPAWASAWAPLLDTWALKRKGTRTHGLSIPSPVMTCTRNYYGGALADTWAILWPWCRLSQARTECVTGPFDQAASFTLFAVEDIADIDATTGAAYMAITTCGFQAGLTGCTIARRPGGTFHATERALVADAYSAFRAAVKGQISAGWVPLGNTNEHSSLANVRQDYTQSQPYVVDRQGAAKMSDKPTQRSPVDRASGDRNSIRLCQTMALYESTE
jgi:hypothetical protein